MNVLLILVICFVAAQIVWGYQKGFILVVYSLFSWILGIFLVSFLSPPVSTYVMEHTMIQQQVEAHVQTQLAHLFADQIEEEADSRMLPFELIDRVFGQPDNPDANLPGAKLYETTTHAISMYIVRGVVYLVVFVLVMCMLRLGGGLLQIVSKLPVLHNANVMLGAGCGLIKGILIVWVIFLVLPIFSATNAGQEIIRLIYQNDLLKWFYLNNPILYLFHEFVG